MQCDGGTEKVRWAGCWMSWFKRVGGGDRKIRPHLRRAARPGLRAEVTDPTLPGKTSKLQVTQTVPQSDTGRQGENPKALERTRVKELGKIAP